MNKYVFLAILTQLVASTIPSVSKFVLSSFAVEPYIAVRWTISAAVFGLLLVFQKENCVWQPKTLVKVSLLGCGGYVLASLGTLYSVKIGGVSFFGLLTLLSPIIVVVLSPLVLKEKISKRTWLALAIALIGVGLMIAGKIEISSASSAILATALVIMAYVFDSLTFLFSKPFRDQLSLLQYLFVAQSAAALLMWGVSLSLYPANSLLPQNWNIWGAILYVALVSCVGVFFVWYWLLKYLQGQQLGLLQYIHGAAAAYLGVIFFNEPWRWSMIAGSLLLLLSILVSAKRKEIQTHV